MKQLAMSKLLDGMIPDKISYFEVDDQHTNCV